MTITWKLLIIGGIIFLLGALLSDSGTSRSFGDFLAYSGISIGLLGILILFINRISPLKKISDQKIAQANELISSQKLKIKEEEMLRLKQLLDNDLITKEEFDDRIKKLKS